MKDHRGMFPQLEPVVSVVSRAFTGCYLDKYHCCRSAIRLQASSYRSRDVVIPDVNWAIDCLAFLWGGVGNAIQTPPHKFHHLSTAERLDFRRSVPAFGPCLVFCISSYFS